MISRPHHRQRVFTLIAQGEVFLIWLIFSFLFWLSVLIYAPGYLEVLSGAMLLVFAIPFLQYGFVIVEVTARGHDQLPRMSANILSTDARVYRLLVVSALLLGLLSQMPAEYRLIASAGLLLITPAITAFLAFHSSIFDCLNPIRVFHFIANMGVTYVALRIVGNSVMLVLLYFLTHGIELFATPIGSLLMSLSACYLLLTMYRGTGVLLHLRHAELGIDVDFSQEKAEQQYQKQIYRAHKKAAIKVSKLLQRGRIGEALNHYQKFLESHQSADPNLLQKCLGEQGVTEMPGLK